MCYCQTILSEYIKLINELLSYLTKPINENLSCLIVIGRDTDTCVLFNFDH